MLLTNQQSHLTSEFSKIVEKAKSVSTKNNHMNGNPTLEFVFLKKDTILNKVYLKDIQWIEALGDYARLHTHESNYVLHTTLKVLEQKLPADKFLRIHRSFIIQLEQIRNIDDNVVAIGDKLIPVGHLYKDDFIKRLNLL
jgi:two-component system LytT family response regulator